MSEKIQEKSEQKFEHLEAEDAEKVAVTAEKKNIEKACEDAAPLEGCITSLFVIFIAILLCF